MARFLAQELLTVPLLRDYIQQLFFSNSQGNHSETLACLLPAFQGILLGRQEMNEKMLYKWQGGSFKALIKTSKKVKNEKILQELPSSVFSHAHPHACKCLHAPCAACSVPS